MNALQIIKDIEVLREKMHKAALAKGISHPEVLKISQRLDLKLNEYNRMINLGRALSGCSKN